MRTLSWVIAGVFCLLASADLHAQAASGEERLRAALRDTTRKLHEAQDELAALRAEVSTLRQAATTATAPKACPEISPRARKQIEQLSAENAALRKYANEAQQMVAKWQEAQTEWQASLQEATQRAQLHEAAARSLQQEGDKSQQQAKARYDDCAAKNARLVQLGSDLLEKYRDKGLWDFLTLAEPVTQIKRVEFEALLQEYGGKIEDNQVNNQEKAVEHGS